MIPLPHKPTITKKEKNSALFEIEALYPGYGTTIGNSLRRVLLSSLEGAAVTQVKIKGAPHEFSTISGIKEDVINILLNLKQLRFKSFSEEPQRAVLKVKGEKAVKASDFEFPAQLEIINKDAPVATLTDKKSELEMEIQIEKGVGYVAQEAMQQNKVAVGVIILDAIFTPVRKVSFKVDNMRVGKRTDFDKLSLEVETDGSITPEQAFDRASSILCQHFTMLCQAEQPKEPAKKEKKAKSTAKKTKKKNQPAGGSSAKGKKKS